MDNELFLKNFLMVKLNMIPKLSQTKWWITFSAHLTFFPEKMDIIFFFSQDMTIYFKNKKFEFAKINVCISLKLEESLKSGKYIFFTR
jgi:hypothetical protein